MPKPKRKPKRATEAEVAQRVEEVLHARLNGAELHDLQAIAREKGWGVSDRQLWRYVTAADRLIEKRFEKDRDRLFRRHVFQRRALYARVLQDGDYRTGLAILKDEAELHGLYPAKRTELSGPQGGPLQTVNATVEMTDDERAAAIAALLARVGTGHAGQAASGEADATRPPLGSAGNPDAGSKNASRPVAAGVAPFSLGADAFEL
jgi:hypothetical protein